MILKRTFWIYVLVVVSLFSCKHARYLQECAGNGAIKNSRSYHLIADPVGYMRQKTSVSINNEVTQSEPNRDSTIREIMDIENIPGIAVRVNISDTSLINRHPDEFDSNMDENTSGETEIVGKILTTLALIIAIALLLALGFLLFDSIAFLVILLFWPGVAMIFSGIFFLLKKKKSKKKKDVPEDYAVDDKAQQKNAVEQGLLIGLIALGGLLIVLAFIIIGIYIALGIIY
ncbi:MAG TPA: hypothetical protein VI731_09660 [Bacteroidia bacterium]|nr:hypothetical protein [Bacteroidia bacterium]